MNNIWEKYAGVLVEHSVNVQKGDLVIIRAESHQATPLIKEIYKQILMRGANPVLRIGLECTKELFIKYANDEQLEYIDPMTELEYDEADKLISIGAPSNVKNMAKADSSKMAKRSRATKSLSEKLMKRSAAGEFKWVIADFPTEALAQEASMSLDDYTQFLFESCHLNLEDPIEKWKQIDSEQKKYCDYLNKTSKIRFVGEKTDVTFSTKDRKWINCSGFFNFPDGEIFTSPVEDSANGEIYFDFPAIYNGNESHEIHLKFENGKVVYASAQKGDEFFQNMINMDDGARLVGEIAIGTNEKIQEITGNILFDEKIGGSIHMALGSSYPETGGVNVSGLHWDLIKNMKKGGKIYADEILIYENGKFII